MAIEFRRVGKAQRAHHLSATLLLNGGHAEPVIGRAFARPVGFAHPTRSPIDGSVTTTMGFAMAQPIYALKTNVQTHTCGAGRALMRWGPWHDNGNFKLRARYEQRLSS